VVTHQLQVERRTGKVRQSETDVLPLCYATNPNVLYTVLILRFLFSAYELLQLLARWPGNLSRILSTTQRPVQTASGVYSKRTVLARATGNESVPIQLAQCWFPWAGHFQC